MGPLDVAGPKTRGQAINRVIGAANQLIVDFLERHHGHHRPEDLLLVHAHLVARAVEHSGLDEKAGLTVAFAAGYRASPLLLAGTQKAGDTIELGLRYQRSHLALRIQAGTQPDGPRRLADALQYAIVALLLYEQTRTRAAALAVIEENRVRGAGNRHIEIRVVEHDVGRFAAEFQRDFLQIIRRRLDDELADLCRAREGHLVHVGMPSQRGTAGLAEAGH